MTVPAIRLLVVDDNEISRDGLVRYFSENDFSVSVATEGREALDLIAAEGFDLVLLAAHLPGMSGLEVLLRVRTSHTRNELPVILISHRAESEDIVCALEKGANDYLTKPVEPKLILARIHMQISLKRAGEAQRESEERHALALAGANDGMWDWNLITGDIAFSERWKGKLGYAGSEIGSNPDEWLGRIHPEDRDRVNLDLAAHIQGTSQHFENEHRIMHRDGNYRWILSRGLALRNRTGIAHRMAGSQTDITAGKTADALTGLPNRALFLERLTRLAARSNRREDNLFAMLFLDLDRFKVINDSLGHIIGDQLLIAFARRLQKELRSSDDVSRDSESHMIARMGGDEFTVLLYDLQLPIHALRVAKRLTESLKRPFIIGTREIYTSASIGVALSSTGYDQPEDLLRDADTAMYRAKAFRRGSVEIFDAAMRASVIARLNLETELRHAADRGEFVTWYQAIVDLESGRIKGFEALVRWQHPTRGLILPDEFISVAEETDVMIALGSQMLNQACRQMREWQEMFPSNPPLTVAVNLSCKHFMRPELISQIPEVMKSTGIDPSTLKLEILESMVMSNPELAETMFAELNAIGVGIGMDDFGTGYSSLSYLHRYPLDFLKVDRSFVGSMEIDRGKLEIVRTVIMLAHNLGIKVIAEGVESYRQMSLLRALGCEFGQGYLFSRPIDARAATELLSVGPQWPATREFTGHL